MKKLVLICLAYILSQLPAQSQTLSVKDLVKAWSETGIAQTEKAEKTYFDLKQNFSLPAFQQRIKELYTYLTNYASKRLEARVCIYDIFGNIYANVSVQSSLFYKKKLTQAILQAQLLKDDQLLSELYTIYAEDFSETIEQKLFYNLKALNIQKRIGIKYFPRNYYLYLGTSLSSLKIGDFKSCVYYGKECLSLIQSPPTDFTNYILQCDAIGYSYLILQNADSGRYYYKKIQEVIAEYKLHADKYLYDPPSSIEYLKIWNGVAQGGIGYGLYLQQKYDEAALLLRNNIASSTEANQWDDAAMAQKRLADIYFIKKKYDSALQLLKQAYYWSKSDNLARKYEILFRITQIYTAIQQFDSAYKYSEKYHVYKDSLQEITNAGKIAVINTRIEYENMQTALSHAINRISKQRIFLFLSVVIIMLLLLIASLLFNRFRIKQKFLKQEADRQQRLALQEVSNAKDQMELFSRHIIEKDELITILHKQLEMHSSTDKDLNIVRQLSEYVLLTDEQWDIFRKDFIKVYPGFFPALLNVLHQLTPAEEILTALIRLQLNNQQIATALGIGKYSVTRSKHRLRQRIGLTDKKELDVYILSIG